MYCASICRIALLYIESRKRGKPITSYNMLKKILNNIKQFCSKKVVKQVIILNKHFSVHFTPMLILVLVTGQYGWMIWLAKVTKVTYRSVDHEDGGNTTVITEKMQEYNAVSFIIFKFVLLDAWLNFIQV